MPANRRRRRAQAARSRQARAHAQTREPLRLPARLGLALGGVALTAVAIYLLVTPHGAHTGRGLAFLFLGGLALIVLAIKAR